MIDLLKVYKIFNVQFKKKFWTLILITILSVILETIGVGIIIPLVSLFNPNSSSKFNFLKNFLQFFYIDINAKQVIIFCLIFLLLFFILKNIFLSFYSWFHNSFSNKFINYVSNQLFETYMKQPYSFHLDNNSAILIRNISGNVEGLRDIVVHFITLISESLIIISVLISELLIPNAILFLIVSSIKYICWGT